MPVVRWLVLHEKAVFAHLVDGGSHLWVTLEYLVEEVARDHVYALLVKLELACQDLLLQLHRIISFHKG